MKGKLIKEEDQYYIEYQTNDNTDDGFGLIGIIKYELYPQKLMFENEVGSEYFFKLKSIKQGIGIKEFAIIVDKEESTGWKDIKDEYLKYFNEIIKNIPSEEMFNIEVIPFDDWIEKNYEVPKKLKL